MSVTTEELDAAFEVAAREARWSINKIPTIRRMLEAAEGVRLRQEAADMERQSAGFTEADKADMRRTNQSSERETS